MWANLDSRVNLPCLLACWLALANPCPSVSGFHSVLHGPWQVKGSQTASQATNPPPRVRMRAVPVPAVLQMDARASRKGVAPSQPPMGLSCGLPCAPCRVGLRMSVRRGSWQNRYQLPNHHQSPLSSFSETCAWLGRGSSTQYGVYAASSSYQTSRPPLLLGVRSLDVSAQFCPCTASGGPPAAVNGLAGTRAEIRRGMHLHSRTYLKCILTYILPSHVTLAHHHTRWHIGGSLQRSQFICLPR